jgi:hypothetical protein
MTHSWARNLIYLLIVAGSLINPPHARADGIFTISTGGISVFSVTFNVNLNVGPQTKDSNGNVSPFTVNYNENITHFDFVANANTNFDFDATNTYEAKISSLWSVDFLLNFTDRGTPFSEPNPGDVLGGSLTAQHLVAPHDGDDPQGDSWAATIAPQDATTIFNNGGARQMTLQLHDPTGDTKNHPKVGHVDAYTNGLLTFNVVAGDIPNEGHINTIQARLVGDHVVPEPSSILLLCSGLLCLALLAWRRATTTG